MKQRYALYIFLYSYCVRSIMQELKITYMYLGFNRSLYVNGNEFRCECEFVLLLNEMCQRIMSKGTCYAALNMKTHLVEKYTYGFLNIATFEVGQILITLFILTLRLIVWYQRADYRLAPSQRERWLQSNAVPHWLGANLESALISYRSKS